MNTLKLQVLTCLALAPFSVSITAPGQPDTGDGKDVPARRMAFPVPEHLSSSLPGPGRAAAVANQRALERAVRFRRGTIDLEPFRDPPAGIHPFERFSVESESGRSRESRARLGSAVLEGAPVAPSFPPDPPPAVPTR